MNQALFVLPRAACRAALGLLIFGATLTNLNAAARVSASTGTLSIPTYPWAAVRHPYFRGTDKVNIYPYPMMDFLSRDKTNRTYRTVVLENQYLRITFLPELGGRIHEVIDKTTGQPMFYVNHVIKPGLIGQCGAWISGGVEWNTGPQGHTVSCLQPAQVRILPRAADGSQSVAIGETERIYGTKWTVVVTLRPDRSFIEERVRIYNPTVFVRPYYFWNCTAAPNTPGFRFIYPMTLGCDHAGEKFFNWPIDNGKDLTRGTNYQDASSIFAWHCDQDFFGSYNDDLDHGAVSCANHHQLPGKKAWTWGQGGFGKMHQMDLTDNDGPYNEVQTGPLLTQAQVGRLEPSEAVEWTEWWYPIHGVGGFTFANQNVAANAEREGSRLELRMIGTREWRKVNVRLLDGSVARELGPCTLTPQRPTWLTLTVPNSSAGVGVELIADGDLLAAFEVPLALPKRSPPGQKPAREGPMDIVQSAWDDYLFARFPEAEKKFQGALGKDARLADAHTGLALLRLDHDPAGAAREADLALDIGNDASGLAHLVRAAAVLGKDDSDALDHAWKASLDPATAASGRALAGRILIGRRQWPAAISALSAPGPWQSDPVCRNYAAFAWLMSGGQKQAAGIAQGTLKTDPLDTFASALLWLAGAERESRLDLTAPGREALDVLELASAFVDLKQPEIAGKIVSHFYLERHIAGPTPTLLGYWSDYLNCAAPDRNTKANTIAPGAPDLLLPHRPHDETVLRAALHRDPRDTIAALYLGDVLFHLGKSSEARELWKQAASAGPGASIACRSLGMAARNLEGDLAAARDWLQKAGSIDPADAIIARDLAVVLFALADKTDAGPEKQKATAQARDVLQRAFAAGRGRSDFVALLARAQNRLGNFSETARMLDTVRVTVWEGSHEVHDLFEQAHLALGEEHLKAGRAAEALREFDRALEYPENLATGKLENARQAHIYYPRGLALAALGRTQEARGSWKLAADEPQSGSANIEEARQKAKQALAGQQ